MLTLRCEGENALAVTAGENVLRLAALLFAFAVLEDVGTAHVIAVVAPLAVSVLALDLLSSRPHPKGSLDTTGQQSVPFGLLAGVPSLLAYLVVPALSILGTTDDLDAFAIASSLGRGPLLIATFAAPALLQTLYSTRMAAALRRVRLGAAALLVVQVAAGALLSLALARPDCPSWVYGGRRLAGVSRDSAGEQLGWIATLAGDRSGRNHFRCRHDDCSPRRPGTPFRCLERSVCRGRCIPRTTGRSIDMIVVTGMHRSGTSLAALVLQALGADFGPDDALYGADDHNADGYLERLEAVDLNLSLIHI